MAEGGFSPDISPKDIAPKPEVVRKAPLDAVVVCGMGPLRLDEHIKGSERLFPIQPYMRLNANAGKLVASNGLVETVIVSGTKTSKIPKDTKDPFAIKERETSEAELLADTFDRMGGKGITPEVKARAGKILRLDTQATTTFDNIIQALNLLDSQHNGYWEGEFGVLSAEFHMPRIEEMIRAFGLQNAHALSAEQILRHYGYEKIYPREYGGKSFEEFQEGVYDNQPAGLESLQNRPAYVTLELAKVTSDRRLSQLANSLKAYYQGRDVALPEVYNQIPTEYDPAFDYNSVREDFACVPYSKITDKNEIKMTPDEYKVLASRTASKTTLLLQEVAPLPEAAAA